MITLRCTQRLLKRLRATPAAGDARAPTSRLGDWYGDVIKGPRPQLALFVSERTLLPVIVPVAPSATLVPRLRAAVAEVLRAIGVPERDVEAELVEMSVVATGPTASRQVLGHMNRFDLALSWFDETECLDLSLRLSKQLCKPVGPARQGLYMVPREKTLDLFAETTRPAGGGVTT